MPRAIGPDLKNLPTVRRQPWHHAQAQFEWLGFSIKVSDAAIPSWRFHGRHRGHAWWPVEPMFASDRHRSVIAHGRTRQKQRHHSLKRIVP